MRSKWANVAASNVAYTGRMARPYRDPIALATTPHMDPATGETVWVVDGLATFGNRGPTDIVFRLGMEYRARAVISDSGEPVWVLEVRRGDEAPETTK